MVDNKELESMLTKALEALKKQEPVNAEAAQLDREIEASEAIHARLVTVLDQYFGEEDNERVVKEMLVGWLDVARRASVGMLRNRRHAVVAYEEFDDEDYLPMRAHKPEVMEEVVDGEESFMVESASGFDWRKFVPTMIGAGLGSGVVAMLNWAMNH